MNNFAIYLPPYEYVAHFFLKNVIYGKKVAGSWFWISVNMTHWRFYPVFISWVVWTLFVSGLILCPPALGCDVLRSLTTKIHIYLEKHSVCLFVRIGTPPPPLPQRVCPSPGTKGGEVLHTRLRVRGRGSPNSNDWRKSLALCLLCVPDHLLLF